MGPGDGHLETDKLLDKTGAELAQRPWIAKHPLVEAAVGLLCRTAATAGAQPVPWTSVHGDYKPDNLIVTEGKLYGLDFDVVHRGPVTLDAAQFLNHLALYFYSPGLLTQLMNRHRIAQAFLEQVRANRRADPASPGAGLDAAASRDPLPRETRAVVAAAQILGDAMDHKAADCRPRGRGQLPV